MTEIALCAHFDPRVRVRVAGPHRFAKVIGAIAFPDMPSNMRLVPRVIAEQCQGQAQVAQRGQAAVGERAIVAV